MKYWLSSLTILAILWGAAWLHPGAALAEPEFEVVSQQYIPLVAKASVTAVPTFPEQVVALVNQERATVGCAPVKQSLQLTSAAQRHSKDMADHDFFSHTGSDQSSPASRALAVGYFAPVGENIAAGQTTPNEVVRAWMNSPAHRANILNCSYKSIGVSYVFDQTDQFGPFCHYWTQDFGTQ